MSYAVRKDGAGWRAVANPDDCDDNEVWNATPPAIPTTAVVDEFPQLTQAQAARLVAFLKANPDIVEAAKL